MGCRTLYKRSAPASPPASTLIEIGHKRTRRCKEQGKIAVRSRRSQCFEPRAAAPLSPHANYSGARRRERLLSSSAGGRGNESSHERRYEGFAHPGCRQPTCIRRALCAARRGDCSWTFSRGGPAGACRGEDRCAAPPGLSRRSARKTGGLGGIEDFLHAYSLSTQEGLALMVLAEALLRVPDADTADRLIEDKLSAADWSLPDVKSNPCWSRPRPGRSASRRG